jgi:deoxyribonuclease-1
MFRVVLLILSAVAFTAHADYPTSFSNAKSKAEKKVYFDRYISVKCCINIRSILITHLVVISRFL